MSKEIEYVPAMTIFKRTVRFEMPVKITYIRALLDGDVETRKRAEIAYLELMRAANDFFEDIPRKTRIEDFVSAFKSLVESIQTRGFDASYPVAVDVNGETMNGQHRTAIAAVLGLDVPTYVDSSNVGGMMNYRRFMNRGVAKEVAAYAIRRYLILNDCARVIPWWRKIPEGAIAWFRGSGVTVISFPNGVPENFPQTHEAAQEVVNRKFPDKGFPNWRRRANLMRLLEPWRRLQILRYKILLKFRKGNRLEKARFHIFELGLRQRGYDLLADFVEKR